MQSEHFEMLCMAPFAAYIASIEGLFPGAADTGGVAEEPETFTTENDKSAESATQQIPSG